MDIIEKLQDKNNTAAYRFLLELEAASAESNELYDYFEKFLKLLSQQSSFVRVRGFRLCCAQAQWDSENKLGYHIDELLAILDDDKPTAVRQCLTALHTVILYKPDLCGRIEEKLRTLNLGKYKDSMRPLIEKDIEELRKAFA